MDGGLSPSLAQARHTVLVATTTWWAFPARIAMEFHRAGFQVAAICPPGQPLTRLRCMGRIYPYDPLHPVRALTHAIDSSRPDLVVPCDDRVVGHLHQLHGADLGGHIARLIEKSCGSPASFPVLSRRSAFIHVAREAGIRAPEMLPVATMAEADAAIARIGFPAVIKTDGTWGGLGVQIVDTRQQAMRAIHQSLQKLPAAKAIKRLLVDRDAHHLLPWLTGEAPHVGVQAFVAGRPANCVASCLAGRLLSLSCVEVIATNGKLGASSVVRVIRHAEMAEAAERLVGLLGLSGFCGLDFMLDDTGAAHLIEINPRSTPLCHLALGAGQEPVAALARALAPAARAEPQPVCNSDIIAYFPQAWHMDPTGGLLAIGHHDVPWQEPALVDELLRTPRPDRGLLATLIRTLRRLWHSRSDDAAMFARGPGGDAQTPMAPLADCHPL